MQTNIGLQALWKSFQHRVHVYAVGVGPGVLEILLQSLAQRIRYLVESDKLSYAQHLRMISRCSRVQPLDDRRHITKDTGVHERWEWVGIVGYSQELPGMESAHSNAADNILTSDEHYTDSEYLLSVRVGRHIAKSHRS